MALVVKNLPTKARDAGDMGSIPWLGRFPRKGHGNPLQCSCLENPMNRGAWPAIVHGVTKNGHDSASEHVRTHTHTGFTENQGTKMGERGHAGEGSWRQENRRGISGSGGGSKEKRITK